MSANNSFSGPALGNAGPDQQPMQKPSEPAAPALQYEQEQGTVNPYAPDWNSPLKHPYPNSDTTR
jgi:hypothetical protein